MKYIEVDSPSPHMRVIKDAPGIEGTLQEVSHYFATAKTQGKYLIKHRYYVQTNKIDNAEQASHRLVRDTEEYVKKGRYHDFKYLKRSLDYEL
jgi:hypothetical protein